VTLTDSEGVTQRREIQLGGGFMSFGAHRLHFGLPARRAVQPVTIQWSTGEESQIAGPLELGRLYHITRSP
jgi:hypothetical protein